MPSGLCACGCGGTTAIALKSNALRGWVRGRPVRFITGHNGTKKRQYRVDRKTGCWIWLLSKTKAGYGKKKHGGRTMLAHRYMFEKANGPIAKGLHLDHDCRRPPCVNPSHLEPKTPLENLENRYVRSR